MFCKNCGAQMDPSMQYCANCGATAEPAPSSPVPSYNNPTANIPPEYRPLGAWAYFGLSLLFCIPIVGFIFLIVFSFNGSNINRRNFARSYWCAWLIIGILLLVIFGLGLTGAAVIGSSYYY